jgi:hypothetical protein
MKKPGAGARNHPLPARQFERVVAADSSQQSSAMFIARLSARDGTRGPSGFAVAGRKETSQVYLSHRSILLAAGLALLGATQPVAGNLCKPVLSLRDVRISEAHEMHRTWTGVLVADASPCSTMSGQFDVQFTRLKEVAPDLQFMERFTWVSGRSQLSLDFWWDEWLEDQRIMSIAPCPCRE